MREFSITVFPLVPVITIRGVLAKHIESIKATGESRVESLKIELAVLDEELEACRPDMHLGGSLSNKELIYKLGEKQQEMRHKKEVCETLEDLEHRVAHGFEHISELLGMSLAEKNNQVSVNEVIEEVEELLDTLMEEREKQTQAQIPGTGLDSISQSSRLNSTNAVYFFHSIRISDNFI